MSRDAVANTVITDVLLREGDIKDVGDGKGLTRFGQTPDWLTQFGLPVPNSVAEAAANYRRWLDLTNLIALCDVFDSLADVVIDWGVHSGHIPAVRALQRALGVRADGVLGPVTESALALVDRPRMARRMLADSDRYKGRLITDDPAQYARFAAGWASRRAEQIERLA